MKPARIRTATLLHFSLQPSDDPARQKVPNFVCYNRCTTLGGSDTAATFAGDIVMDDAGAAQFNVVTRVFGGHWHYAHLMCYCHAITKVVERTKGMPKDMDASLLR
ncbi:hypothetical protein GQ600_16653 [Phytophthora cactorum]|nr:hypothetical protein GQ600_16653 [Phytophthora cactorum]